jgi:hypothetical protein
LALFVLGVLTNDDNALLAAHSLAILTDFFNGRSNFHKNIAEQII